MLFFAPSNIKGIYDAYELKAKNPKGKQLCLLLDNNVASPITALLKPKASNDKNALYQRRLFSALMALSIHVGIKFNPEFAIYE